MIVYRLTVIDLGIIGTFESRSEAEDYAQTRYCGYDYYVDDLRY